MNGFLRHLKISIKIAGVSQRYEHTKITTTRKGILWTNKSYMLMSHHGVQFLLVVDKFFIYTI